MSMVKKTKDWWVKVLADPSKLNTWLVRLYNNEKDAYERFLGFSQQYCQPNSEAWHLFHFIALQELRHGQTVLEVLEKRGIVERGNPVVNERYWGKVLPCIESMETAAGVGALAEQLSLERMRVIIDCADTPSDIKEMFEQIEPDESVHARSLAVLAGKHGIKEVIDCHSAGLEALGLKLKKKMKFKLIYDGDDTRVDEYPEDYPELEGEEFFPTFEQAAKNAIEYLEVVIDSAQASIAHLKSGYGTWKTED